MSLSASLARVSPVLVGLSLLSATAAAQPPLSPPAFLPGDAAVRPAAGDQREPSLAPGPDGVSLLAWSDWRADRTGTLTLDETGSDVYAARVGPGGALLDPIPIPIDRGAGFQDAPRVAWNGVHWLVTWHSQEPTQFYWAGAIRGVRVSPAGQVVDAAPIDVLVYDWSNSVEYALGTDATGWIVAAQGSSAGEEDLVVRRIAADGSLPAAPKKLLDATQLHFDLSLARAGNVNLLSYRAATSTLAVRFDDNLNKLDATPFVLGGGGSSNSLGVASDGAQFLVAWGAYTSTTQVGQVRVARMTPAGQVLDPGGKQVTLESLLSQPYVRVAWDGANFLVSWLPNPFLNGPDLRVCRVNAAGQVLDPGGVSTPPSPQAKLTELVSAGVPGGGVRFAWTDTRAGGPYPQDVHTLSVTPTLQKGPEAVVSQGAPRQTGACVVTSDQGFVVFYRSETSGSMRIVGQRLDAWGNPVDPQPYTVHGPAPHLGRPRAARIGGEFLVTWAEDGAQRARRILADGAPLDAAPITIQPVSAEGVDVAALNGRYLAVGVNNPTHVHVQSVFGVRLSSTGAPLDPAATAIGASYARAPRAVAHAGRWFVTWTRNATHDNPIASVASVFVQPDGAVIANVDLSPSLSGLHGADVAVTGGTALAVWSEPTASGHDIHGTRVDAAGVPLDGPFGVPLLAAAETQRAAAVGSTGTGYALLCEDQRSKTFFLDDRTDLYGARVDTNGVSLDPSGFPVLAEDVPVVEPSVAGGAGRAVLAFSRFEPGAPYAAYRLTLRVLNPCHGAGSTSGSGCPGSGGFTPSLSHGGCPSPGESAAIVLEGGLGGAQAFLVFGQAPATLPAGFGCDLHVAPLLPFTVPLTLTSGGAGDGAATLPFLTPAGLLGVVHTQAFLVDPGAAGGFTASNALSLHFQ